MYKRAVRRTLMGHLHESGVGVTALRTTVPRGSILATRNYVVTEEDLHLEKHLSPALKARFQVDTSKPETLAEFASKWQSDSPELAQVVREVDEVLDNLEKQPLTSFTPNSAYIYDIHKEVKTLAAI